ncbi:MAG: hypothetical protein ACTSVV_17825 [Promethearchaeota archaeon]
MGWSIHSFVQTAVTNFIRKKGHSAILMPGFASIKVKYTAWDINAQSSTFITVIGSSPCITSRFREIKVNIPFLKRPSSIFLNWA